MIHVSALVDAGARLGRGVVVGPFSVVGAHVTLGDEVSLASHVVALGPSTLGARVKVHSFAVLGGAPQDRTYDGEPTELVVGDDTIIREHVTLHRGTRKDRGKTEVGKRCLLMVGVHVAHDVVVGDDCTIANACQLAGHVVLEAGVNLGGAVALAPFVRVGALAFVAAGARVEHDVPPFHIAQGDRARVRALNVVGLRRRGVPDDSIAALERAHRRIYRAGSIMSRALDEVAREENDTYVRTLVAFLRERTTLPGPR